MRKNDRFEQELSVVGAARRAKAFGIKTMTVVVTVAMLVSGVPTRVIAEGLQEAGVIAAQDSADQSASDSGQQATAQSNTQEQPQAAPEQAAQPSSQDNAAAAQNNSTSAQPAPSAQPSQQTETADIALTLNNASITYKGQVVAQPAQKVTAPTSDSFEFTVLPDNGYKLSKVTLTVSGADRELKADANGLYTVDAADVAQSPRVTLETEQEKAAEPAKEATPIEDAEGVDDESNDAASNDVAAAANEENVSVASDVSGEPGETINAKVGDTVTLNGTSNVGYYWFWKWYDCGYRHNWKATGDNKNAVTINGSGESVSVTFAKAGTYTIEHKYCKKEHSSGNHDTDEETFTVKVSDNSATSLTIFGDSSVKQFETTQLTTNASDVTWTSSDSSVATIDASGKVTGVAEGKVTITATALTAEDKVLTATHDVTVTKSTAQTKSAKLFFLKSPSSNPDSNTAGDWFPPNGSSDLNVEVNTEGAAFSGKNTWDNVANRVVSWPDGSTGTSWTLPKTNTYWMSVFDNYKSEVQKNLGVKITKDDVEAIILHPYKISNNSSSYHLDCKVEIKVKQVVTATFWVQSPGAAGFDKQYSVSTLEVKDGTAQVVAPEAPEAEKTVKGTKYKFMGWYSDQACTQLVSFPVTTSENVFYYGKYVPCDQSIQVNYYLDGTATPVHPSKTLTGYMKGQKVTQTPIDVPGYTPVSHDAKTGIVGTDASIDFYYTANTVNYKVEYYWNGSGEPFETDNASGKYGDIVNITPKSFSGYTAVSNDAQSLKLLVDENQNVVKFYYYKNVTLTANSDTKPYNGSE